MVTDSNLLGDASAACAHLALSLGTMDSDDPAAAEDDLERALELSRRSPWFQPLLTLQVLIPMATMHAKLGEGEAAQRTVDEADKIVNDAADVGILAVKAHDLATSIDDEQQLPGEPLTERELIVLRLIPTPATQAEIGAQLYLSINTVKSHARSIFRKLGVGSRTEAVAKARKMGLV